MSELSAADTAADLVDAIATDLNAEDFDLSFTGIGEVYTYTYTEFPYIPAPRLVVLYLLPSVFRVCDRWLRLQETTKQQKSLVLWKRIRQSSALASRIIT